MDFVRNLESVPTGRRGFPSGQISAVHADLAQGFTGVVTPMVKPSHHGSPVLSEKYDENCFLKNQYDVLVLRASERIKPST